MSIKRDAYAGGIVVGVLLIVLFGVIYFFAPHNQPSLTMHLGDGVFKTWVVKGNHHGDDQTNRLTDVPNLDITSALLIKYNKNDRWPIYMKQVNYPIDIVWLNANKEVVSIAKNVQTDAYPYKAYEPKHNSRYVVELVAGTVDKKAIAPGRVATFQIDEEHKGEIEP